MTHPSFVQSLGCVPQTCSGCVQPTHSTPSSSPQLQQSTSQREHPLPSSSSVCQNHYLFHLDHFSCTTQLYAASPLWPLVFVDGSECVSHSDTEPTVQSPEQLYWDSLCWGCWVAKSCHYTLFHVMDGHGREEAWTPLCGSLAELDSSLSQLVLQSWLQETSPQLFREWELASHLERSVWFPECSFGRLEEIYLGFPLWFSFWII